VAQDRVLELDPNVWLAYVWRGAHRAAQGRLAEACADAEKAYGLAPWNVIAIGLHAGLLHLNGDPAAARVIGKLGDGTAFGAPCGLVTYYALRSELDVAAEWYEKAIQQWDTRAPWITANLIGDRVTSHARWVALRGMMKLPQAESAAG